METQPCTGTRHHIPLFQLRYLKSEVNVSYLHYKQHYCSAARQKRDAISTCDTTSDCPEKHNEKSTPDGYKNVKNEPLGVPTTLLDATGTKARHGNESLSFPPMM